MNKPLPDGRPAAESKLGNEARQTLSRLRRWEKRLAEATENVEFERTALAELHRKACERFARDLPTDVFLLDVLELVDIEEGDRWIWRGPRNNRDLAAVKVRDGGTVSREMSVVRYLAIELGVIAEDEFGTLYPTNGDTEDINPWHRTLRAAERPTGNPNRYRFNLNGDSDGS